MKRSEAGFWLDLYDLNHWLPGYCPWCKDLGREYIAFTFREWDRFKHGLDPDLDYSARRRRFERWKALGKALGVRVPLSRFDHYQRLVLADYFAAVSEGSVCVFDVRDVERMADMAAGVPCSAGSGV